MVLQPTLDNTFGALQVGAMIAIFLFGTISLQTHSYFRDYKGDKLWLRGMVVLIWLLELGHTIGLCVEVYRSTIVYSGRPFAYDNFKGIGSATLLGGIITMLVQVYFSFRLWRLLPPPFNYTGLVCVFLSVIRGGFAFYLAHVALRATSVADYTSTAKWLITLLLSMGAALDIAIAVSMLYFFMSKRKNALKHTVQIVDRLLTYTITTGLLTSITAVAVLICFSIAPQTFIWVGLYCFLAKLYSNSFLSSLNERQELRNKMSSSLFIEGPSSGNVGVLGRRSGKPTISVAVDIKTETKMDMGMDMDMDMDSLQSPRNWDRPNAMLSLPSPASGSGSFEVKKSKSSFV